MRQLIANLFFLFVFSLATLGAAPSSQAAPPQCAQVHQNSNLLSRGQLVSYVLSQNIPSVAVPTDHGVIPAILLNRETGGKLRSLFNQSIGVIVSYQPGYPNDHGMLRIFETLLDLDAPGARHMGEINQTGISWVSLPGYLQFAQGKNRVRIEVVYALTPKEMESTILYHKMRRAAIIRAPFRFGNVQDQRSLLNQLRSNGEHCFVFCTGSGVGGELSEMKMRFNDYKLGDIENVLSQEDVQAWLKGVEQKLWEANGNDERTLNAYLPIRVGVPLSLQEALAPLETEKRAEVLNWLVGYSLSQKYLKVLSNLQISGGNAYEGINNSRAVAVFVYDGVATAEQFQNKNYEALGVFSKWTHAKAQPLREAFPPAKAPVRPPLQKAMPAGSPMGEEPGFFGKLVKFLFG